MVFPEKPTPWILMKLQCCSRTTFPNFCITYCAIVQKFVIAREVAPIRAGRTSDSRGLVAGIVHVDRYPSIRPQEGARRVARRRRVILLLQVGDGRKVGVAHRVVEPEPVVVDDQVHLAPE